MSWLFISSSPDFCVLFVQEVIKCSSSEIGTNILQKIALLCGWVLANRKICDILHFYRNNNDFLFRIATKMSISAWLRQREIFGKSTFSVKEVQAEFPSMSSQVIQNELSRLSKKRVILPVYKGFYVKLPPYYIAAETVPADFYITQLMQYLGKPYYIGLLSAGELLGAAHQRPQRFNVFTTLPCASTSERRNPYLDWHYRRSIPDKLLLQKNSETAAIRYSNPELTALDLVQYSQHIGGLSMAATVIAELLEQIDFAKVDQSFFETGTSLAFQRLGYIIDEVLGEHGQAKMLYERLKETGCAFRWTELIKKSPQLKIFANNTHWHIYVNAELEVDDL